MDNDFLGIHLSMIGCGLVAEAFPGGHAGRRRAEGGIEAHGLGVDHCAEAGRTHETLWDLKIRALRVNEVVRLMTACRSPRLCAWIQCGHSRLAGLVQAVVASTILVAGCSIPVKSGTTTHHLIIGFGVVSTNDTPDAAVVTNMTAIGFALTDRPGLKFALGYASSAVIEIPDNAEDVRIEVSQRAFGPINVVVPRAALRKD